MVEFGVLGLLEVSHRGHPLAVRGAKTRTVLAMLLLQPNHPVSADRLIEALWGESPPPSAAATLQSYVSQLRRVLEPTRQDGDDERLIQTHHRAYLLAVEPDRIDAKRFERLLREGRRALDSGEAERAANTLTDALGLWRGPALADFTYDSFAQHEIARLEELHLVAVEDQAEAELALGRHREVAGRLQALVDQHPLRERLWGHLMTALYRSGQQAAALRAYERLRAGLAEEVGLDPSPKLRRLEAAILAQDPELDWCAAAPDRSQGERIGDDDRSPGSSLESPCMRVPFPPALSRPTAHPLLGRQAELDRLVAVWTEVANRSPRAVFIAGEPGVGKTRLAAELAKQAYLQDAVVLAGRCDEGMGVPYQPFVESFRHYAHHSCDCHLAEHLGRWPGDLLRLAPEIAARLPDVTPALTSDPETERYRLFDAVASWLSAASAQRPVLLVVDDVHWATTPTLLLVRHVLRSTEPMQLLMVATYRDTELSGCQAFVEFLADVASEPGESRLDLKGLGEGDVGDLISLAAGDRVGPNRSSWAAVVHADTRGNPFFVGEVVRHMLETGVLSSRSRPSGSLADLGIPESVRAVITRRLSRLSPATAKVLSVASVAGFEFEPEVVQLAARLDEDAVFSALEEATASGIVEEAPVAGLRYHFSHALVRTALYGQMARARRAVLHRRIGEAIETLDGRHSDQRVAELANHFAEAAGGGSDRQAASYAERAGDSALAQLAHEEAVGYYRRAVSLLDANTPDPEEASQYCALLISLGEAQRRAGDPRCRETLLEGARRALRLGDADRLAQAALANNRGRFGVAGEVDDERVEILRAALSAYPPGDSGVRARLLAQLAVELVATGDTAARLALSDQALAMARRVGDPETTVLVLNLRFGALWTASKLRERLEIMAEAQELAARLVNPTPAFFAAMCACHAATEAGEIAAADRLLATLHDVAETLNQPVLKWFDRVAHAKRAVMAGALDEAERLAEEGFSLGQATGQPDAMRRFAAQLFSLRFHQGRLAELLPLAEEGFAPRSATGSLPTLSGMGLALVYCEVGRWNDAQRVFDDLMADDLAGLPEDFAWLPAIALAATACSYLGDERRAETLSRLLAPYRTQFVDLGPVWFGSTAHYLGLIARVAGDLEQAETEFCHAAAQHSRIDSPVWLARTQLEWGEMLSSRGDPGDRQRGETLLHAARRTAVRFGLGGIERRVERLLPRQA